MEQHVTVADVQRLLPNLTIPSEDAEYVESLADEAVDLIRAYCRGGFGGTLPEEVKRVAARMVARAYSSETSATDIPAGATSTSMSAGPFSRSYGFESGSTSSGVWLSASDKQRLRPYRGRVFTVRPY